MKCPFCGSDDTQVKDSRPTEENSAIRRRRACNNCGQRFTTFERIQLRELTVIKSSGSREPLDREKLARSMRIALRKRPVDPERVELVVNGIIRRLEGSGETEVRSEDIGQLIMDALALSTRSPMSGSPRSTATSARRGTSRPSWIPCAPTTSMRMRSPRGGRTIPRRRLFYNILRRVTRHYHGDLVFTSKGVTP